MHVLYIYTTPLCTKPSEILHCWKARFSVDGECNCTMCDVHGQWACTLVYGKDVAHFIFGLGQLQNRKTMQCITKYWGSWLTPQCIYNLSKLWYFVWCFWCILASTVYKGGLGCWHIVRATLTGYLTELQLSSMFPTGQLPPLLVHTIGSANIWFCNLCNICRLCTQLGRQIFEFWNVQIFDSAICAIFAAAAVDACALLFVANCHPQCLFYRCHNATCINCEGKNIF